MVDLLSIPNMAGGLHTESDPRRIPDNACAIAQNVLFDKGGVRVRPGRTAHTTTLPGTGGLTGLTEYFNRDFSPACRLIGQIGSNLYQTDATMQNSFNVTPITAASGRVRMEQFKDQLYICDGLNAVKRWNPGAGLKVLNDVGSPDTEPAVSTDAVTVAVGNCQIGSTVGYTNSWRPNQNHWQLYGWNLNWSPIDYFGCRLLTTPDNCTNGHTASTCMEVYGTNNDHYYFGDWLGIQYLGADGVNLEDAGMLKITFKLVRGNETSITTSVEFGEEWNGEKHLACSVPLDMSTVNDNEWTTVEVDISSFEKAARDKVKYIGIFWHTPDNSGHSSGKNPPRRLELTSSVSHAGQTTGFSFVVDSIKADISSAIISPGRYEFTYTFAYDQGDGTFVESSPFTSDDPQKVYPYIDVTDNLTLGFSVVCTVPANSPASKLYLYVRGGTSDDWRRVDERAISASDTVQTIEIDWDGTIEPDDAFLDQYVSVPPTGAELLMEFNGRMLYTAQWPYEDERSGQSDTLYISNWDDAERCPTDPLWRTNAIYGGFIRIGGDGQAVTGLGRLGSYGLIFKSGSTYLFSGAEPPFEVRQLSDAIGCISHETIEQLDGTMIAWLDREHVWAWTGQGFKDIGEPITERLKQLALTSDFSQAFAVYDTDNRLYMLTLPPSTTGTNAGVTMTFDLRTGAWTEWAAQPAGCAYYAHRTTIRGVYAGDIAYRQMCRLNAGTTDNGQAISWAWVSKAFLLPYPLHYKDVKKIVARFITKDTGSNTLTVGLRMNINSVNDAQRTLTLPIEPGQPARVEWRPPVLPDCSAFQIALQGVSSADFEVSTIDAVVGAKGML